MAGKRAKAPSKGVIGNPIEPKPPTIIQNLVWLIRYGREHKLYVFLAALIGAASIAYPLLDKQDIFRGTKVKSPKENAGALTKPKQETEKGIPALRVRFTDGTVGHVSISYVMALDIPSAPSVVRIYGDQKRAQAELDLAVRGTAFKLLEARTMAEARLQRSAIEQSITELTKAAQKRTGHTLEQMTILEIEPAR